MIWLHELQDAGSIGKSFEAAFLHACDLLGLQYRPNGKSGRLWDLQPIGKGWRRLLSGETTNLKVSGTKWLFASRFLALILPWDPVDFDDTYDPAKAVNDVTAHLESLGLSKILWMRPKDKAIQTAIHQAAVAEDVAKLDKLMVAVNFESFKMHPYKVKVNLARSGPPRVGSVSIIYGGKTVARSEKPRKMGGSVMVAFRTEGRVPRDTHPLKVKSRLAASMIEQVLAGRDCRKVLQEERQI